VNLDRLEKHILVSKVDLDENCDSISMFEMALPQRLKKKTAVLMGSLWAGYAVAEDGLHDDLYPSFNEMGWA
jgi:hypothetical protein